MMKIFRMCVLSTNRHICVISLFENLLSLKSGSQTSSLVVLAYRGFRNAR